MARPKSDRKAPDAGSAFLRFSADEFARIRSAMDRIYGGRPGGSAVTVAAFCRDLILGQVDQINAGKK